METILEYNCLVHHNTVVNLKAFVFLKGESSTTQLRPRDVDGDRAYTTLRVTEIPPPRRYCPAAVSPQDYRSTVEEMTFGLPTASLHHAVLRDQITCDMLNRVGFSNEDTFKFLKHGLSTFFLQAVVRLWQLLRTSELSLKMEVHVYTRDRRAGDDDDFVGGYRGGGIRR